MTRGSRATLVVAVALGASLVRGLDGQGRDTTQARPPLGAPAPHVPAPPPSPLPGSGASPPAVAPAPADTAKLIKPAAALWRSLLIPGWGQARTGRNVTGAAFVTWEGVTMMMTLRAVQEERYLKAAGSGSLQGKRQQIQDWVVLWAFNHLFAGAEAFVSAHLQDFPKELKLETTPHTVGISVPVH
jgi:hypothetical protein